jgi:hypothetical protein
LEATHLNNHALARFGTVFDKSAHKNLRRARKTRYGIEVPRVLKQDGGHQFVELARPAPARRNRA